MMRGTAAKRIRRKVYGDRPSNPKGRRYARLATGQIITDDLRRRYQQAKRDHRRRP